MQSKELKDVLLLNDDDSAELLGMLLHQGVPGFERWFGTRPEVDEETRRVVLG